MARTNYERGREVEYKCRKELEKEGFRTVRTSGSKGDWDVIAYNNKVVRFIQLKREKERRGHYPAIRNEIREIGLPNTLKIVRELWIWTDYEGWKIFTIGQDGEDESIDLRRKRRSTGTKAKSSRGNKPSNRSKNKSRR